MTSHLITYWQALFLEPQNSVDGSSFESAEKGIFLHSNSNEALQCNRRTYKVQTNHCEDNKMAVIDRLS
jgi:hypothetical protein